MKDPRITNHAYARAAQRFGISPEILEEQARMAWHQGKIVTIEREFAGRRWVFTPAGLLVTVIGVDKAKRGTG